MVPFEGGGCEGHVGEGVCVRGAPVPFLFLVGLASEVEVDVEEELVTLLHKTKRGRVREVRRLEWKRLGAKDRGGGGGAHRNRRRAAAVVRTSANQNDGLGAQIEWGGEGKGRGPRGLLIEQEMEGN